MPIFYPFSSFSSPSCPLCSPKPEAFGPLQQLCPAFGWVRDWAAQGSSCHSFPWRRSGRARRWHGWRNLKHVAGPCPTALWRTRSCLLYLTGFSCGKCWGRRGRGTANVNTCEYVVQCPSATNHNTTELSQLLVQKSLYLLLYRQEN